ncbi:hypothetical protein [Dyadobacter sp. 3J3]|uniref:hypothetical protein n=1 Tax=Dyadobacter sp. 3J3 TaxID=2606600 RepID=UPI00135AA2FE|nr:hypothetical protein [Dyadobacter sp. 3J3]
MKQKLNINLKLPIFSWLFFLFLSSGVSYYDNLQFGKPVQIERVDQLIPNCGKKKAFAKFSISSKKSYFNQQQNFQFILINLLSLRLNNHAHILLNRQYSLFKPVSQNTIPLFRSRNLASTSSDDFPDFIS